MAIRTEIAEIMESPSRVYSIAERAVASRFNMNAFSKEERETAEVIDAWASEIGKQGDDKGRLIAAFVKRTIEEPIDNKADELIELMLEEDAIGEFDAYVVEKAPENTLIAYDAAKAGNVDKSYIDGTAVTPTWKHAQVETEIPFSKLRSGGFKSIANLSVYAAEALKNHKIMSVFTTLDAAVTGGEQVFAVTGADPTAEALDKLALWCIDNADEGDTPFMFALNKYAQKIAKMAGYASFMSEDMKNDYNRYGLVNMYQGCLIGGYSGAKKTGNGELIVPDKRIFGVSGKIGVIADRGELRIYEYPDYDREAMQFKFTGYEYGIAITNPEKVAKITFSA